MPFINLNNLTTAMRPSIKSTFSDLTRKISISTLTKTQKNTKNTSEMYFARLTNF
jgi:hypothetical protein